MRSKHLTAAGGENGYKNVEIEKNTKVFDVIIKIIKLGLKC